MTTPQGMLADRLSSEPSYQITQADVTLIIAALRASPAGNVGRGLIEQCADIALAIDSGRGNEKEIANAIRRLAPAVAPDGAREPDAWQARFKAPGECWFQVGPTDHGNLEHFEYRPLYALAIPALPGIEGREALAKQFDEILDERSIWDDVHPALRAEILDNLVRVAAPARHPHHLVEDRRAETIEECAKASEAVAFGYRFSDGGDTNMSLAINKATKAIRALAHPLEPATEAGER